MSPAQIEKMGRLMPHARAIVCENGSHMSMYDDQARYFAALLGFLRQHGRS
jgi:proline iminopeptidase